MVYPLDVTLQFLKMEHDNWQWEQEHGVSWEEAVQEEQNMETPAISLSWDQPTKYGYRRGFDYALVAPFQSFDGTLDLSGTSGKAIRKGCIGMEDIWHGYSSLYDMCLYASCNTLPEVSDLIQEVPALADPTFQNRLVERSYTPGVLGLELPAELAERLCLSVSKWLDQKAIVFLWPITTLVLRWSKLTRLLNKPYKKNVWNTIE